MEVDYEALPETSPLSLHLFAGALAGIAEHTIMYPIDTLRTRMQVVNPNPQAIYSSVTSALTRISTTEGSRALWRGVSSMVLGAGPSHALYFATYEQCKLYAGTRYHNTHMQHVVHGASGACATVISDAFMNPFDVVKQRMQMHGSTYRSSYQCALSILHKEGVGALYVSYPTTLLMTVPFQAIQFAVYEHVRAWLNPTNTYSPMTHIIAGGMAGSLAAAATTPLDVCKTVLQTRTTSDKVDGIVSAMRVIVQRQGMWGFFQGWRPRVISHMPSTAIAWTVYEYVKYFLGNKEQEGEELSLSYH
jgi:solute carrier family 25 iron transporter 28/37